ncbi:MAG: oligosaccharide flippase family protein [Bacteroidales bacterium]|jgi:O-antigen/teichoic acid export membrane protein|nr:oligosaccharide flippase family protein [Bacteroidales bacterium]
MFLNNFFRKRSSFTRNVLLIGGGTIFAQAVNMLLSPIITRLYTPEDYGILSVYSSILGLIAIISSLKYELAIPIADDDETAVNILLLCFIILIGFILCITVILVFAGTWIIRIFNIKNFNDFKFYIPFGVFLIGSYTIFTQWAFRKRDYAAISKTKYFQTISQNIVKIGLGIFHSSYIGLLLGTIAGESTGITTLFIPFLKKGRQLLKNIDISRIKCGAKRYMNFPRFTVLGQVFNSSGTYLPPLLMSYLFSNQMVGYYGLAHTVVSLPIAVIGDSVSDVFYGEAAVLAKKDIPKLRRLVLKLTCQISLISLIPLIILFFWGPFLFSMVFGEAWRESGIYARIIAALILFRFISAPIDKVYSIFEKQKTALFLNILRAVVILIVFFFSKQLKVDSYLFLGLYSGAMSIIYIIIFFSALKIIDDKIKGFA